MTVLFPPVLESQAPAFQYFVDSGSTRFFEIRFTMPAMVDVKDIQHLQVSLKYANTGESAVNPTYSPDKSTLFISASSVFFYQETSGNYVLRIPYYCFGNGGPMADTTYLVQVRFGSVGLWLANITGLEGGNFSNFAAWRANATTSVPSLFGEWSNIQRVYCYTSATHEIGFNFYDFVPQITWTYAPVGDDPVEQVKIVYCYEGFQEQIIKSEVFSGQYNEDNVFTVEAKLKVAPVVPIAVSLEAVTVNNTIYGDTITIPSCLGNYGLLPVLDGEISDTPLYPQEQEDGILAKTIVIPKDMPLEWKYNVYRIDTLSLECIKIISNQQLLIGEELTFKDYTVEMGIDYQYAVAVVVNDKITSLLNDLYPFGPKNPGYGRLMKMDSAYLTTRGHQLRLQGNVQVSAFKRNTQDAFQTTIGGKYPFYSRASQINYRTFTINALVSINFDPTSAFMRLDAFNKLKLNDVLSEDQYSILISASPGVAKYFREFDIDPETKRPQYLFDGNPTDVSEPLSQDQIVALVNRCAASLIMNGLWWDDDNGNSQLIIQDRDILTTEEFSLSRRRVADQHNRDNEQLIQLGTEINGCPEEGQILPQIWGPTSVYGRYLHRQSGLDYGTSPTDSLVFTERKFREKVMEWLSDGKPKLFRSETEGNMIVMVSAPSFTPFDKSNRMVYSMSATITEIADLTTENLEQYNLIPTYIKSVYNGNSEYDYVWGQTDPNVVTELQYNYDYSWDIPNMLIGDATKALSTNTLPGVKNRRGVLTFSAEGLPPGITLNPVTGVIEGYPQGISETMEPGKATLKVYDAALDETASCQVPYGYMYTKLEKIEDIIINPVSGSKFLVGEIISPVAVSAKIKGGVAPYTYYGSNLPGGISVNAETGIISGSFGSAMEDGSGQITVRDYMGQMVTLEVKFSGSVYPLTFVHLDEFDYGYTEIGKDIPHVDVMPGAYGGIPFYTASGVPYYEFAFATNTSRPAKWVLKRENYDVQGRPVLDNSPDIAEVRWVIKKDLSASNLEEEIATIAPGTFDVVVTDAKGTQRAITIYYDRILEQFKFEWSPTFDVLYDPGTGTFKPTIPLTTDIANISVVSGVSGGLPFADSDHPYRFDAVNLLPNYRITANGDIVGKAQIAMGQKFAHVYATDARGERIEMMGNVNNPNDYGVTLSEVTASISFDIGAITIHDLRQGIVLDNAMLQGNPPAKNKNVSMLTKDGETLDTCRIDLAQIHPTIEDVNDIEITLQPRALNGIRVEPHVPVTGTPYWTFEGTPTGPYGKTTAYLQILKKSTGEALQIPVYFEECIGTLVWDGVTPPSISAYPGEDFSVLFTGISGGTPGETGYSMYWAPVQGNPLPAWLAACTFEPQSVMSTSGWRLVGTMPEEEITSDIAKTYDIEIKDAIGQTALGHVNLSTNKRRLSLSVITQPFNNVELLNEIDVIPEAQRTILRAMGGTTPYSYSYSKGVLPGGFDLTNENDGGMIVGKISRTPKEEVAISANEGPNFMVTDATGKTATSTTAWYGPRVTNPPRLGAKVTDTGSYEQNGILYHTGEMSVGALKKGVNYTSDAIFEYLVYKDIHIKEPVGTMPTGLNWGYNNSKLYFQGVVAAESGAQEVTFEIWVPATAYHQEIHWQVKVKFAGVTGKLTWDPPETSIPTQEVGATVTLDLGAAVDGIGPFLWTYEPTNANCSLSTSGPESRQATLTVKFPKEEEAYSITITVTDSATNIAVERTFLIGAARAPLVVTVKTPIKVNAAKEGDTIDVAVDDNLTITGGVPPYYVQDDDGIFGDRGYQYGGGKISGTVGSTSYKEEVRQLYVYDSGGQVKPFDVTLGAIEGDPMFITSKLEELRIPAGRAGATINLTIDLTPAIAGVGTQNAQIYFENVPTDLWRQKGGEITIQNPRTLKVTKRPTEPVPTGSILINMEINGIEYSGRLPYGAQQ